MALLRAINVGGRTVKMDRLRVLFEKAGLAKVSTYIASGNVLFETASRNVSTLESLIETRLQEGLGFHVTTFVRTPAELAAAAAHQPFPDLKDPRDDKDAALYVAFLKEAPAADRCATLLSIGTGAERFAVHGREAWWLSAAGMGKSKFSGAALEKTLGTAATMRNITTVRKLAAL